MQSSFSLRKSSLKIILGFFFLVFAGNLYGQKITGLTSQQFYEHYGDQLNDGDLLIIDGRSERMFALGRIGNAVNIDADSEDLEKQMQQYLDRPLIVVYCTTIRRTIDIINKLKGVYEGEIIGITDGIKGWKENNLPVNEGEEITHDEAIEEALNNNRDIKSSKMIVEVAGAGI